MQWIFRCLALVVVLLPGWALAQEDERTPSIQVMGEGVVSVRPDTAILYLTVTRQADSARQALSENNSAMSEVISALKEKGIQENDLQTSSFSINPVYQRADKQLQDEAPAIAGYRVSNSLTVRVRELAKAGEILDMSVDLGVNEGGNITFTKDDPSETLKEARRLAVADSLEKAKTIADAAGVKLGRILEANEQNQFMPPVPMAQSRTMTMELRESVPIESGQNEYRVLVFVSYAIEETPEN